MSTQQMIDHAYFLSYLLYNIFLCFMHRFVHSCKPLLPQSLTSLYLTITLPQTFSVVRHETTAGSLNMTLLELAQHPDKQQRRRNKIIALGREPTYEGLTIPDSAWKSSLKTAKKPRLNRTQTAQDRKFPGPSKTATAVQSSVHQDFGNFKTDKRPV